MLNHYDSKGTANDRKYKLWIICHVKTYVGDTKQQKSEGVVIILRAINAARYVMYLLNGRIKDVLVVGLFWEQNHVIPQN